MRADPSETGEVSAIEEAERERIARALHQIVWTADADGLVDWISDSFFELVGTRDVDMANRGWRQYIHPDDVAPTLEAWDRAAETEEPYAIELRFRRHDGVLRWHLLTHAPVHDEAGRIVRWYGGGIDIHDRKAAEAALRSSEARLRATLENEPECVKVVAADGELLEMNPAGLAMIEVGSRDEAIGQRVADLIHQEDRRSFVAFHRAVLAGAPGELRFRIVGRRGTTRWVESRSVALAASDDQPAAVLSITRDITQRMHQDLVRDAEGHVLALLASGADLDDVLEAIATSLDEISGALTSIHLVDPRDGSLRHAAAPRLPPEFSAAIDGSKTGPSAGSCGTSVHRRAVVIVGDIAVDPLWDDYRQLALPHGLRACWSTPVFSASGDVVATLAQYYLEPRMPSDADRRISERLARLISIAVDRVRADEELRASEHRFRTVAQATSDVVWDWDVVNDTVWRAGDLAELIGKPSAELEGTSDSWKGFVHPDDQVRVDEGFQAAVRGTATAWADEYRLLRADGAVEHVRERASIIRDESGRAIRVVGSSVDITRELELERQLQQSQRLESIGHLTGGIAHDFNNLLTVILGTSELLQRALPERPDLVSLAATSRAAALRGAELTARLLAFARRQPLDPSAVDVNALLDRVDGLLSRTLGEHIALAFVRADDLRPALVDAGQLESAVLNLCINARDAMPGGGALTIETGNVHLDTTTQGITAEIRPGPYVLISVSDTGEGMSAEVAARAFDPFFTTKPVGSGSGLGLSMVYGFAKQSMGHASIYSEVGQGTTVRLYLPQAETSATPFEEGHPEAELERGTEMILVVEDDDLVRTHVARQLEGLGYGVLLAANGADALAMLDGPTPVDLLFTDIVMPGGMNGRELAALARSSHPELPVLFTSGYAEQALVQDGRIEAGLMLLDKPYRMTELANKVRAALESRPPQP